MDLLIGKRIRDLRSSRLETQELFAGRAGISAKMLSHYETGKTIPPIDILMKISLYCHVSLDYIAFGRDDDLSKKMKIGDSQLFEFIMQYNQLPRHKKKQLKSAFQIFIKGIH